MKSDVVLAGFIAMAAAGAAAAQADYPQRPVRMIIPFAPGGAGDFVGRILATKLGEQLGQQFVADNRGGAAGNIGVEIAAQAIPDGYTLLLGNIGAIAINPSVYRTSTVKPTRDLTAITLVVDVPGILVVHPSLPVKSVKELIDYAKERPGKLNFASPGSGSANRLDMEVFRKAAGLEMTHIPYKGGAGPAVTALLGGETQLMFTTLPSAVNFAKAGRLRALAVTSPQRDAVLPEIPTMAEIGYPGSTGGSWQGLFVPKGVPAPIVDKLFATTRKILAHDDTKQRLAQAGVQVIVSQSPAEFGRFVAAETQKWGRVVQESGATAD